MRLDLHVLHIPCKGKLYLYAVILSVLLQSPTTAAELFYKFGHESTPLLQDAAKRKCADMMGHGWRLAWPKTQAESDRMIKANIDSLPEFWIDLRRRPAGRDRRWYWRVGERGAMMLAAWLNWDAGEPINRPRFRCAVARLDSGKWVSKRCGHKTRNYVCQKECTVCPDGEKSACTATADTVCKVNGNWGTWSGWSACSVTCGTGSRSRSRVCDRPATQHGGTTCPGADTETEDCTEDTCPVITEALSRAVMNGNWGTWSSFSACSVTCGTGSRSRSRVCDRPAPQHGGTTCPGKNIDTGTCSTQLPCPVAKPCSPNPPCLHGGSCVEMPPGYFYCVCQGTGYTGQMCEKETPEDVEASHSDDPVDDPYYKGRVVGYVQAAESFYIPSTFLLVIIFGLLDFVNWHVRKILAAREKLKKERREGRRRSRHQRAGRKRLPVKIKNRFVSAVVNFIGWCFRKQIVSIMKETREKKKIEKQNKMETEILRTIITRIAMRNAITALALGKGEHVRTPSPAASQAHTQQSPSESTSSYYFSGFESDSTETKASGKGLAVATSNATIDEFLAHGHSTMSPSVEEGAGNDRPLVATFSNTTIEEFLAKLPSGKEGKKRNDDKSKMLGASSSNTTIDEFLSQQPKRNDMNANHKKSQRSKKRGCSQRSKKR